MSHPPRGVHDEPTNPWREVVGVADPGRFGKSAPVYLLSCGHRIRSRSPRVKWTRCIVCPFESNVPLSSPALRLRRGSPKAPDAPTS